nr:polysaccharide biosynthesis C-terminal domain-containing protein [Clostridia bacterium]
MNSLKSVSSGLSIKQNYIFSLLYKVIAVLVPVLITPHLDRVLEPDGNGAISFVSSIASYFILLANLGIEGYGQRAVAMHRDDKEFLHKFVMEIFVLKIFLTLFSGTVFVVLFSIIGGAKTEMYLIFSISVFFVAFDFSWLFQGLENFRILAITHLLARAAYVVFVFLLVSTKQHINVAAFLWVGMTVVSYLLSFPFVIRFFKADKSVKLKPFSHLKESIVYFIPAIAVSVYTILDKTMIGIITGSDFENGYYEEADKIVKLVLTVVTTLNIIMRSRISYCFARGEFDRVKDYIRQTAHLAFMLCFPMAFGLLAVSRPFINIYCGVKFGKSILLLRLLCPLILIIATSNILGTHYYTPFNKQRTSNKFLIAGAIVNIIFNIPLIYFMQSVGAAIASVIAEFTILVLYAVNANRFFAFKEFLKISWKYAACSAIMFVAVALAVHFLPEGILWLVLEILGGIVVYFVLLLVFRAEFLLSHMKNLAARLKKRKQQDN